MLEVVKSTILSVNDRVIEEPCTDIRSLWIYFLSDMLKYGTIFSQYIPMASRSYSRLVSFPEIVPTILKLYIKADSESEVWKRAHRDFLMPGNHEISRSKFAYRFGTWF